MAKTVVCRPSEGPAAVVGDALTESMSSGRGVWPGPGVGGVEFEGGILGAGEGAAGFFVEASGGGFAGGGQEGVVGGVGR